MRQRFYHVQWTIAKEMMVEKDDVVIIRLKND